MDELLKNQYLFLKKLANVFDSARDGLWYMGLDDNVFFYNNTFYKQFDIPLDKSTLEDWTKLIHPEDLESFSKKVKRHKFGNVERVDSRYRVLNKQGEYLWIDAVGVIVTDNDETYMVGCHKDITEQKHLEDKLYHLAYYDLATGLENKKGWLRDITNETKRLNIAVSINNLNTYQRCWGEQAIIELVELINDFCKRKTLDEYKLYRIKDDLLVIRTKSNVNDCDLINTIDILESKFNERFDSKNIISFNDISIGVFGDEFVNDDTHFNVLLKVIDYAALNNQLTIYDGDVVSRIDRLFVLRDSVKKAIDNDEFYCVFQPIICSKTSEVISFEALARWEHDDLGHVSPVEFLPIIEELGLICKFGFNVFNKSLDFICEYNDKFNSEISINVNISVHQLSDMNFVDKLIDTVSTYPISYDKVVIEVTESHILDDHSINVEQLNSAISKGFKLSLDDFGTGYSSLISLFRLNVDQLKIDKSLVHDSMSIPSCLAMLKHLIQHCQDNGVELVAEGVETDEMHHFLMELGANCLQGYLFSKPKKREYWLSQPDCFNY